MSASTTVESMRDARARKRLSRLAFSITALVISSTTLAPSLRVDSTGTRWVDRDQAEPAQAQGVQDLPDQRLVAQPVRCLTTIKRTNFAIAIDGRPRSRAVCSHARVTGRRVAEHAIQPRQILDAPAPRPPAPRPTATPPPPTPTDQKPVHEQADRLEPPGRTALVLTDRDATLYVASLARGAAWELADTTPPGRRRLFEELVDLPSQALSPLVTPPKLISPELARLRQAIARDDPDWGWDALTAVAAQIDTPRQRALLAGALVDLREQGRIDHRQAAAAIIDLDSRSTRFIAASLLQAVAISVGAERTPGGLQIAA